MVTSQVVVAGNAFHLTSGGDTAKQRLTGALIKAMQMMRLYYRFKTRCI